MINAPIPNPIAVPTVYLSFKAAKIPATTPGNPAVIAPAQSPSFILT